LVSGNTTIIGTNTVFDREFVETDYINVSTGEALRVNKIISPTEMTVTYAPSVESAAATMTIVGNSDVWNDRFLKAYATAKIKYQWGSNLSKFAGIQMPGGVTLDGPRIMAEAKEDLDKLEENMFNFNSLPSEIFVG
jgi:hypothetical protein